MFNKLSSRYLSIISLFVSGVAYQYIYVVGEIIRAQRNLNRTIVVDIIELFPIVYLGIDIMLYFVLPILVIYSALVLFGDFGWKKSILILGILGLIFFYFIDIVSLGFYFDR